MLATFFSVRGRSPVPRTLVVTIASLGVAWGAVLLMRDGSMATVTLAGAVCGAAAAKLGGELARRRHDRAGRGRTAVLALLGLVVAYGAYALFLIPEGVFDVVALVTAAWLAWTLLAPGDRSANLYGPVPGGWLTASGAAPTIAATTVGLLMTFVGALTGYAGVAWTEAVARRHAATLHRIEMRSGALDLSPSGRLTLAEEQAA